MICRCGRAAETGIAPVYGWLYAGCGYCGIYTSADTQEQLESQWERNQWFNMVNVPWWEMGIDLD